MSTPFGQYLLALYKQCKQFIINLNLCHSARKPATNPYDIYTQILSTRVYITLVLMSISIYTFYLSQVTITSTINIEHPTYDQYLSLYKVYNQTLSCPCSTLSVRYDQFIRINVSFHPVCDSLYVTSAWQNYIDSSIHLQNLSPHFPSTISHSFQALANLCHLAKMMLTTGLSDFNGKHFITGKLLSADALLQESNEALRSFLYGITTSFIRSISLVQDVTYANGIVSGLLTMHALVVEKSIVNNESQKLFMLYYKAVHPKDLH
ncbi:unnamed protein product [Adineta ricciae]|uniref:Uncharacterized protein n=1 Tax=Adineta ricciae TaxID=249248 RepID=A0A816FKS4_ADIRI|nr:unnamed protein product [Adineta ricciae]